MPGCDLGFREVCGIGIRHSGNEVLIGFQPPGGNLGADRTAIIVKMSKVENTARSSQPKIPTALVDYRGMVVNL